MYRINYYIYPFFKLVNVQLQYDRRLHITLPIYCPRELPLTQLAIAKRPMMSWAFRSSASE